MSKIARETVLAIAYFLQAGLDVIGDTMQHHKNQANSKFEK